MRQGPTVVVSPQIALQRDQVASIREEKGGGAVAVNSTIGAKARRLAFDRRLGDHGEPPSVGRPVGLVPEVDDAPFRLAGGAHHEDPAPGALRAPGDEASVGGERRLAVVLRAVLGQRDGPAAVGALEEQVGVPAVLLDEDEALTVGGEARPPLGDPEV